MFALGMFDESSQSENAAILVAHILRVEDLWGALIRSATSSLSRVLLLGGDSGKTHGDLILLYFCASRLCMFASILNFVVAVERVGGLSVEVLVETRPVGATTVLSVSARAFRFPASGILNSAVEKEETRKLSVLPTILTERRSSTLEGLVGDGHNGLLFDFVPWQTRLPAAGTTSRSLD